MLLLMDYSNKSMKKLIQILVVQWWRAIKLQEELFCPPIGVKSQIKTTKVKIDHQLQMDKCGETKLRKSRSKEINDYQDLEIKFKD